MGAPPIRRFGDACLRRVAQPVAVDARETGALLERLWKTLAADGGVGLAAPQIGVSSRVVVVRDPDRPAGQQRLDLINPVICETFGPDEAFEEGCLSFPGLYTIVMRPRGAVFEYQVPGESQPRRVRDEGLLARIVQHEVDHLDGVLFVDHLSPGQRLWLGPKLLWIMGRRWFGI